MQASADYPLCIDLDGTLTKADLSRESLIGVLRRAPWLLLALPLWLRRGISGLKAELARRAQPDVAVLPYNDEVLELVRVARERGRRVVLVTGSNVAFAEQVQAHLQLFDEVLASDAHVNLTGKRKAQVLNERFGHGRYEYVANGFVDLPIWQSAGAAVTVNAPKGVVARVANLGKPHTVIRTDGPGLRVWPKAIRVHQWAKNALLFVPLMTAHRVLDAAGLAAVGLAFLCMGLCASATYIINDLFDLDSDRHHAKKRHRPFASGALTVDAGVIAAALMLATGVGLSFLLPLGFRLALLAYLVTTLLYSFWLKRVASLDVLLLAGLYTLRIIAGALAAEVALSFWLLAFSMFMFLGLALVKRVAELLDLDKKAPAGSVDARKARGREYHTADIPVLQALGAGSGYLAVLVLALYINSPEVALLYETPEILWLVAPVLLLWVTRLWVVTARGYMHEDPVFFAIKDPETWVTAVLTVAIMAAATLVHL